MTEQQKHRGRITEKCLEHGKKYLKENKEKSEEDKKKSKECKETQILSMSLEKLQHHLEQSIEPIVKILEILKS